MNFSPMLQINSLSYSIDATHQILHRINATLIPSEIYGIAGRSGAGKSSLLNILAGLLDQSEGEVVLQNQLLPRASQRLIPGHPGIALVAQDYALDLFHTCEENIREVILNWEPRLRERRVKHLLNVFSLSQVKATKAKFLSGGEQQRLAIARAIATKPSWLLLDEPFSHLDHVLKLRLITLLLQLKETEHICLVLVSHDAQDMLTICSKMAFLRQGKLTAFFNPTERYHNLTNLQEARWFGEVNSINWKGTNHRFRPNDFRVDPEGIPVSCERYLFNGTIFIHYFYTESRELVILHSITKLPLTLKIRSNGFR
jgi:ABC-type sulfate/molybdate transport systems ATPase subunit